MDFSITKELIFDYFNGNASALQKKMIDEWAKKPENEELFYAYLVEWELSRPQYTVDVAAGIDRYRQYVATRSSEVPLEVPATPIDEPRPLFRQLMFWYAAASVAVLLLAGWLFRSEITYQTYATAPGEIQAWVLPDGSKVTLNANSSLRVPRFGFGQRSREVLLNGEAEFSVVHKPNDQKFVVKTGNRLDVVVLGTEFTVYTRARRTQVVLNRGKVELQSQPMSNSPAKEPLIMLPGDLVTVDEGGVMQRKKVDEPKQYAAWTEHRYVFDGTKLSEVARLLSENYGLSVEITDPKIADWTVSGSFKAVDANELLNSISQVLGIQYSRQKNKVIFSPNPS
ncbi:hypothetical protein GCM10027275_21460 [Rhabdobacter roseus]|uniref:Ferric-dicitrate binding protein FerR (Iron transport regulator) n=1 Tax=Rhabdobacter roseus TaxID=1655419 RepID=A0A840TKQ1_9BACT|nr:FecR domain-containing protein [Rhabdobacter roseus]MBB5284081.1 ferric-dicitrate binding protein FerR (iron transport regulator) [Rhabdobacter roseus]